MKKSAKKEKKQQLENGLTEKQKLFCQEYIYDWNGARSYKAVYKNITDETAKVNASRMLTKANVKAYVQYLKENLAEAAGVSPLMVLQEHKKLAFSSIAHLHLTWITRKEFETLTDEQKSCIQEISTKTNTVFDNVKQFPVEVEYVKIKLYDKQKSLDSINKMLGWDAPTKTALTDTQGNDIKTVGLIPIVVTTPEQAAKLNEKTDPDHGA